MVDDDEPLLVVKTEKVCCKMRPRAFGWIMYEWFFLLVCLIGVTCFTFTQYLISEAMPGQNRTFIYGFQYQGGLRVLAL